MRTPLLLAVPFAVLAALSVHDAASGPGTGTLTIANLESAALQFASDGPGAEYGLTVQLPGRHVAERPNDQVIVRISWEDAADDYDLSVVDEDGAELARSSGFLPTQEEVRLPARAGTRQWRVRAIPVRGAGEWNGLAFLQPGPTLEKVAGPDAPRGDYAAPRFQIYHSPQGRGIRAGEPTLFKNPNTANTMFIAVLETLRVSFDDATSPARDTWSLHSPVNGTLQSLDPLLDGDRQTGRIFNSQLIGANSLFAYSDDEGETWTPGQIGPPNGGADHQSIAIGPYGPDTLPGLPGLLYPNAVYYCSQSVAAAFCARSDDGGTTFGPGIPLYPITDCYGLHGHPKIAPDGTVVLPNKSCLDSPGPTLLVDGHPAVVVSTDSGVTWDVRTVPTGTSGGGVDDPSVAVASDSSSIYLAYMENGGRLKVAVSRDLGLSWESDQDILTQAGVEHVAFPVAVAGDPDRALVFFLGTQDLGNYADAAFEGTWYPYFSYTQDGGKTWVTQKLAEDIVQRNGVCGGGACRNLLDFNDGVIDENGFVQIGYADGCLGSCELTGPNSFQSQAVIARQSGGPSLFAANDPAEPALPKVPRVEGYRAHDFVELNWPATDDGGAAISGYKVYRSGSDVALATVTSTSYTDTTASDPAQAYSYEVAAVNAAGEGARSAPLELAVGDNVPADERSCAAPGFPALIDPPNADEADAPIKTAATDILEVLAFEPEGTDELGLTLRMAGFTAAERLTQYTIRFGVEGGEHGENGNHYYVRLDNGSTSGGPVRTVIGYLNPIGALVETGELSVAAEEVEGEIRFRIPKELIGNPAPGTRVSQVFAMTSLINPTTGLPAGVPGAASPWLRDRAGFGQYLLVGNDFCAKGARLQAPGASVPAQKDVNRYGGALGWMTLLGLVLGTLRFAQPARHARCP